MFHKEGKKIILGTSLAFAASLALCFYNCGIFIGLLCLLVFVFWILVLQFFRNPTRTVESPDNSILYAPADGKVVVIEETEETEYLKDRRIQISIFMSPFNVHVNRNPISGTVEYARYHAGKYLMAWDPKSSTENERTTIVYNTGSHKILMRQIAGFVARRIIYYLKDNMSVKQGDDMGFIRFGSRVDLYLPLDTEILVKHGDIAVGNKTVIGKLKS